MHNFKPGDLALTLIDQFDWPAGSVVSLYVFCPAGSAHKAPNCSFVSQKDEWVCISEAYDHGQCYRPNELMPLTGDFAPERQNSQELPA